MPELTAIKDADGDALKVSGELLPPLYEELRKLAAARMAREAPFQTLQPTALVHEVWLRLTRSGEQRWQNRAHFFAAAAEAMRRILVERARRKRRLRHGGDQQRVELEQANVMAEGEDARMLELDEALQALELQSPDQAQVVKLRFFAGLGNSEIATALGVSEKTVQRYWAHAKAWLYQRIQAES
jgi:RNA polymerase sigma factor (TIGR02999 family)